MAVFIYQNSDFLQGSFPWILITEGPDLGNQGPTIQEGPRPGPSYADVRRR